MGNDVLMQFSRASSLYEKKMLGSGDADLDAFLGGGIPMGGVSIWYSSLGSQMREVLLNWVRRIHLQEKRPVLWILALNGVDILASAWASRGVDLELMYFAQSSNPIQDMREVFFSNVFPLIVIDGILLTQDEQAFLSVCARSRQQSIVILENQRIKASSWHPTIRQRIQFKAVNHGVELVRDGSSFRLSLDLVGD